MDENTQSENKAGTSQSAAQSNTLSIKIQRKLIYLSEFEFPYLARMDKYQKLAKIGSGTFGVVFKGKDKETDTFVALKKVVQEKNTQGFPVTALREINILKSMDHQNVVKLLEIVTSNETTNELPVIYLVFEFCEYDLAGILANMDLQLTLAETKGIMNQIFEGLFYIHEQLILHRDFKPANILIKNPGIVKIADFGLSRAEIIRPQELEKPFQKMFTTNVVTMWYRPPELLMGAKTYSTAIDLWSAGCLMAEIWTRFPILRGNSEQEQLKMITLLCGSVDQDVWPDIVNMPMYGKILLLRGQPRQLKQRLAGHISSDLALDLLDKLLQIDPAKRINANLALSHDFFWKEPLPGSLDTLMVKLENLKFFRKKLPQIQRIQETEHFQDRVF